MCPSSTNRVNFHLSVRKFNWRAFSKLRPQARRVPLGVSVREYRCVYQFATCVSFRSRLCASNRYCRGLPVHAPSRFSRVGMSFFALHSRMQRASGPDDFDNKNNRLLYMDSWSYWNSRISSDQRATEFVEIRGWKSVLEKEEVVQHSQYARSVLIGLAANETKPGPS